MNTSKDDRAKHARNTINKTIPAILKSDARARHGVESARLIVDPPAAKPASASSSHSRRSRSPSGTRISLQATDTLTAARSLLSSSSTSSSYTAAQSSKHARIAILNMASPLRPGGGVLTGASSQEEFLCARTTLYPSLREKFYRLPDVGGVYTTDVLVFGSSDLDAHELPKAEWFFVDVVTAAMLRLPDVVHRDGEDRYAEEKDHEVVVDKMRAVMRMCKAKGARKIVLGAWGCGAYANPVGEVARAWRRVLLGTGKRAGEAWDGLEVVFAIRDGNMAKDFATRFGEGLEVVKVPGDAEGYVAEGE